MNRLRQDTIRALVENKNIVTIKEIKELFPDVSLMTIHRDLDALEKEGVLSKYRGGVKSIRHPDDVDFTVRLKENNSGKLIMAKKAISLIKPHTSVFLDAGTSNLFMARNLSDINLNIFTTAPSIALELCRLHNPAITLCGGSLNRNTLAVSGRNTIDLLSGINVDMAFIGVSGCSIDAGFTCGSEADSLTKSFVIKKARTSVIMCDSEKLKRLMPYTFASMEDIDYIISDRELAPEYKEHAKRAGVVIL